MRLLYTLKFQIGVALLVLLLAFASTVYVSQYVLAEQLYAEKIIQLGGKLQQSAQQLSRQATNYLASTPDALTTYDRDLSLYYQDLMQHIVTFDMIEDAFMGKPVSQEMTGMDDMTEIKLSAELTDEVKSLHHTWVVWRASLMAQLGDEPSMPRLLQAASYIDINASVLMEATDQLLAGLTDHAQLRKTQLEQLNQFMLVFSVLLGLGIVIWFYRRVIQPLDQAGKGMQRIALGDFEYRLPVQGNDEFTVVNEQFNRLSQQLDSLFQLMSRLHEGGNLDEILRFISEEFSRVLPLDWIGILFATGDGKIQLERGYADRHAEGFGSIRFDLEGTLLQQAMQSQQPLHIPDIEARLSENKVYKFLNILVSKNCKEAIFVPLQDSQALQGVLVFASRESHSYTSEHLALLRNLTLLITLSFNRTVKLADYQHFAAIGQFATGIAHEIRSPLATINMALDYFTATELPDNLRKRARLAGAEAERVRRLMEDILMYARPHNVRTQPIDLHELLNQLLELYAPALAEKQLNMEIIVPGQLPDTEADPDRLRQVLVNLLTNAIQASAVGGRIIVEVELMPATGWLQLTINNQGETIEDEDLERVFEPFFTTRAHGTGLGLNIARRIIEAHGGEMTVASDLEYGTTFKIALPPAQQEVASSTV